MVIFLKTGKINWSAKSISYGIHHVNKNSYVTIIILFFFTFRRLSAFTLGAFAVLPLPHRIGLHPRPFLRSRSARACRPATPPVCPDDRPTRRRDGHVVFHVLLLGRHRSQRRRLRQIDIPASHFVGRWRKTTSTDSGKLKRQFLWRRFLLIRVTFLYKKLLYYHV